MILKTKKHEIIKKFKTHEKDTGSVEVQVAVITERIKELTEHFQVHTRDHHSRLGLLKLVGKRRRLLDYIKLRDSNRYKNIIQLLNIRK